MTVRDSGMVDRDRRGFVVDVGVGVGARSRRRPKKVAKPAASVPHSDPSRRQLWDKPAVCALCCLVWTLSVPVPLSAEGRPLAHSAFLYRVARAPDTERIEALLERADDRAREGMRVLPGGFRLICERTLALPLPADNPAVREGRRRALTVLARQALVRKARLDAALTELDHAERLDPYNAEVTQTRARVLALWEEPTSVELCEVQSRAADAAATLTRLHALHPELRSSESMFELGGLFAREGAYTEAAAAYRSAIAFAFDRAELSAAYGQLAEVSMLAGDASAALPHYEHAIARADPGSASALLRFGLAVALDRAGEQADALEQAVVAVEEAGRSLDVLGPDSVLFEPAFERTIYEGLAHEALAQVSPESRVASLQTAAQRYTTFLTQVDRDHIYRNAAEADLRRVLGELKDHGASAPSPTAWLGRRSSPAANVNANSRE